MSPFSVLRTFRRSSVVRWLTFLLFISVFIGGFLFHIYAGLGQLPERWPSFLWNVYFSFIYSTLMFGSLRITAHWLHKRVPFESRWAVALHAGTLSLVAVASYSLATLLCWGLHPNSFSVRWEALVITATIAFLVTLAWSSFMYMSTFYQRLRKAEAAKYEARLEALRAQINPHFLFNAFNSIAALIRTRPEEAETVVEDLADLFRYTLQASKEDVATLGEEVQAARLYLTIERARFRDRLNLEIDVPERLRSVSVPSMTLQPLVENAVKHGVGQTHAPCTVAVAAQQENDTLLLRVTDTGPGFETNDLDTVLSEGTGLANVRERVQLFFGDEARMQLLPQGIELRLPLEAEVEAPPTTAAMAETG